jgi:uncharacterized spore protein YtfJ
MAVNAQGQEAVIVRNGRVKVRIWTMTKNADIEKLVDMIFAMVKEFAQISKRENFTREKRKDR